MFVEHTDGEDTAM